ncbi:MAG: alkane 1-monooxygenase [SAR202 cluster bacterium Io17-Chloro-G4]|nr:MAG: alkane 1-monooxygenase [SAR202 cluster bacterium Io17-Chloro-G4]
MAKVELKLSVLDQSPVYDSETEAEALQHTIELAQKAEAWGYNRFWVTEHHGSNKVMGSSPEVLVSHLLAKTDRIRVGSGGVMLQHYSPFKVAENFSVLASLAPGRVDLGIGRGPGGLPQTTAALRSNATQADATDGGKTFLEKLLDLEKFLHNRLEVSHPHHGLKLSPTPPQAPDLFLLGTTPSSGEMAASVGMTYIFALFLNSDESVMWEAVKSYRSGFADTNGAKAHAMLALPVIVADSDEEAAGYASEIHVVRILLESGKTFTVFSVEAAEDFGNQSGEKFSYEILPSNVINGAPETVRERLCGIQNDYQIDEIFVVTAIDDFQKRLHSYELLSREFNLLG